MLIPLALALVLAGAGAAFGQDTAADVASLRADIERLTAGRDWPAAIERLTRLRAIALAGGDRLAEAESLRRIGLAQQQLKSYDAARTAFTNALNILVSLGQRAGAGQLREDLGGLSWTIGDWAGVRTNYGDAVADYEAAQHPERVVSALRNMTFAADMSMLERLSIIERAWSIAKDLADPRMKGLVRHQLGDILNVLGDQDRAIVELEAAVQLLDGTTRELIAALTSLGRSYRLHGYTDKALEIYARVLPMAEQAQDIHLLGQTYDAIGTAYWSAGRWQESLAPFQRAIELARKSGRPATLQHYTLNYATSLAFLGDPRGLDLVRPMLDLDLPVDAKKIVHSVAAVAFRQAGDFDRAVSEATTSIEFNRTSGDRRQLLMALHLRALAHQSRKDRAAAIADVTAALDVYEELLAKASPRDELRRQFGDPLSGLFALAIALHRDGGDAAGAFQLAERARARAFRDLMAARDRERAAGGAATAALPADAIPPAPDLAELRNTVARMGTTLLAYWTALDETTVWVVTPSGAITSARVAVTPARIETLTKQVWQTSTAPASNPSMTLAARSGSKLTLGGQPGPALRELYELLIAPVQQALPQDEGSLLTIVPHGVVFNVPFAALMNGNRYLVERYRLHYVASAALMQPAATAPQRQRVLLVADPAPMPSIDRVPLQALPGARREVQAIARLLPASSTTTLTGARATESRLRASTGQRDAVHLATHGLVYDDRPFDSFLALAPEPGADGRLTTSEIYGLRLNANLVVMSGCRTATGQLTGDGVHGLARAFFYAGTPSVVATLWDLPDAPAQHLFPEFYRAWLGGADRSTALRAAQLSLLRALRRGAISIDTPLGTVKVPEHPAVWAGPVLLGQP